MKFICDQETGLYTSRKKNARMLDMRVIGMFFCALGKRWWALMSCAAFTAIAIYAAWKQETSHWILDVSIVAAIAMFLVAAGMAWNDERKARISAEVMYGWESIARRFKELDDGGVLIARWSKNLSSGTRTWEIQGHSVQMQNISTEIIKMAGKRILVSNFASALFDHRIADDRDRWLEAMVKVLGIGKVTGNGSSVVKDIRTDFENGAIKNLTGESQRMCLRLLNEETVD